jgi:hypothetical protein
MRYSIDGLFMILSFSRKAGAVWIYTAPTLILILKYENIKLKNRIPSGRGPTSLL